jgi:hypothetical protein
MLNIGLTGLSALAGAALALSGCSKHISDTEAPGSEFVVTCMGGAWDTGPCTAIATGRCKGEGAMLLGALASTYLPANKLHQTVARYRCQQGRRDARASAGASPATDQADHCRPSCGVRTEQRTDRSSQADG